MSKNAPAPPDYTAAANTQAAASKDITNMQTFANRPNINTPWGNQSWSTGAQIDPATGQKVTSWTQNNTLTPAAQSALTDQQGITSQKSQIAKGLMGQAQDQLNTPIDYNSAQPLTGMSGDSGSFYNKAGDAVMGQFNRYQAPQMQQQRDAQIAQLNAQGLKPGDQAYDNAMKNMDSQQDQARQGAMDSAVQQSSSVGSNMFGQNLQQTQLNNTVHQQQIADMLQKQGFGLNEVNSILNGQQIAMPNMPSFSQASKSETPQLLQAANDQFNAGMTQYNAQQQQTQGLMSGAGSAAMMFSDRRLKTKIRKIGKINGHNLYAYEYVWGTPSVGVMADEVSHVPGAVIRHSSGYDMVDYGVICG